MAGIAHESFSLMLNTLYKGQVPSYVPLNVSFSYDFNYKTNMGQAYIQQINGTDVGLNMFPMGIGGQLDFMRSDHFNVTVGDETFVVFRTILDMHLPENPKETENPTTPFKSAALMLGAAGDDIITTENFEKN